MILLGSSIRVKFLLVAWRDRHTPLQKKRLAAYLDACYTFKEFVPQWPRDEPWRGDPPGQGLRHTGHFSSAPSQRVSAADALRPADQRDYRRFGGKSGLGDSLMILARSPLSCA